VCCQEQAHQLLEPLKQKKKAAKKEFHRCQNSTHKQAVVVAATPPTMQLRPSHRLIRM